MKTLVALLEGVIRKVELIKVQAPSYDMKYRSLKIRMDDIGMRLKRIKEEVEQRKEEIEQPKCIYCGDREIYFDDEKDRYFCYKCKKNFGVK